MLKKQNRLLTNYEFNKVRRLGKRYSGDFLHIYYLDVSKHVKDPNTKVGIVVSNNFSKVAVKRNRVKRVFREVIRQNFGKIKPGFWIVIYPKVKSLEKKYEEINIDFNKTLQNVSFSS